MSNIIQKLSIIIPVFNEEKTIQQILKKVHHVELSHRIKKEIIVVNNCSKDRTTEELYTFISEHPKATITVLNHEVNQGKGAALHTGIADATGAYLIIQDADLEYDPEEYKILLKPVIDGFADVVYGSRFRGGAAHRILFFWHSIGNKFLIFLTNIITNLNLTDMETCYKLVHTPTIQSLTLYEKRFGFEPEVTIKLSRIPHIRIYEVGISYYGKKKGKNWDIRFKYRIPLNKPHLSLISTRKTSYHLLSHGSLRFVLMSRF